MNNQTTPGPIIALINVERSYNAQKEALQQHIEHLEKLEARRDELRDEIARSAYYELAEDIRSTKSWEKLVDILNKVCALGFKYTPNLAERIKNNYNFMEMIVEYWDINSYWLNQLPSVTLPNPEQIGSGLYTAPYGGSFSGPDLLAMFQSPIVNDSFLSKQVWSAIEHAIEKQETVNEEDLTAIRKARFILEYCLPPLVLRFRDSFMIKPPAINNHLYAHRLGGLGGMTSNPIY